MRLEVAMLVPQLDPAGQRLVDGVESCSSASSVTRCRTGTAGPSIPWRGLLGHARRRPVTVLVRAQTRRWASGPWAARVASGEARAAGRARRSHVRLRLPELPEVESVRRQLAPELTGRRINESGATPIPEQRLSRRRARSGSPDRGRHRRGKYLAPARRRRGRRRLELVLHLGMTGSLPLRRRGDDPDPAHAFSLDDGRSCCSATRADSDASRSSRPGDLRARSRRWQRSVRSPCRATSTATLRRGAQRTTAPVKARLLGQRLVAGVGNIYADEALWRAPHPPGSRRVVEPHATRSTRPSSGHRRRDRTGGHDVPGLPDGERRAGATPTSWTPTGRTGRPALAAAPPAPHRRGPARHHLLPELSAPLTTPPPTTLRRHADTPL